MIRKPENLPVIDVLVVVLSVLGALLSMLCIVPMAVAALTPALAD